MALLGKLLIAVGSLLLLHAGYYSVKCAFPLSVSLSPSPLSISLNQLSSSPPLSLDAEFVKLAEVTDAKFPPTEVRPPPFSLLFT